MTAITSRLRQELTRSVSVARRITPSAARLFDDLLALLVATAVLFALLTL